MSEIQNLVDQLVDACQAEAAGQLLADTPQVAGVTFSASGIRAMVSNPVALAVQVLASTGTPARDRSSE